MPRGGALRAGFFPESPNPFLKVLIHSLPNGDAWLRPALELMQSLRHSRFHQLSTAALFGEGGAGFRDVDAHEVGGTGFFARHNLYPPSTLQQEQDAGKYAELPALRFLFMEPVAYRCQEIQKNDKMSEIIHYHTPRQSANLAQASSRRF